MRVLHLPVNIASIPSHTVRGLGRIGVNARGLVFINAPVQSEEALQVIVLASRLRKHYMMTQGIRWLHQYLKWVAWADVIHWYFGARALPWGLDLAYLRALRKPAIVEWLGSDIRIPEVECQDNPYYASAFQKGYEYASESFKKSCHVQRRFARAGFASMTSIGLLPHMQTDLFPKIYVLPQRLVLSDYVPAYPDPAISRPLVLHSPTAPVAKGTPAVLEAVERLKGRISFDFQIIHGVPRQEALQMVQKADIFLDQFVSGEYGMATLEAMALGKPVVCYIKPSMVGKYPPDCPIVNANQDNLREVLESLLNKGRVRHEIGRESRTYVEKYHDAAVLAHKLVEIYKEMMVRKNRL
jgi:hypothetical protein